MPNAIPISATRFIQILPLLIHHQKQAKAKIRTLPKKNNKRFYSLNPVFQALSRFCHADFEFITYLSHSKFGNWWVVRPYLLSEFILLEHFNSNKQQIQIYLFSHHIVVPAACLWGLCVFPT